MIKFGFVGSWASALLQQLTGIYYYLGGFQLLTTVRGKDHMLILKI